MLDKSIPYHNCIMCARENKMSGQGAPLVPLNFTLRSFLPGDELAWAQIETAVLEFDQVDKARQYFEKEYKPYPEELGQRCFLLFDGENKPVATASAWFDVIDGAVYPKVHWVAVVPGYQGQGLGRLIMEKVLWYFGEHHPGEFIYLHTQTWSHKAIWLYRQLGFSLVKNKEPFVDQTIPLHYRSRENDFDKTLPILQKVLGSEKGFLLAQEAL